MLSLLFNWERCEILEIRIFYCSKTSFGWASQGCISNGFVSWRCRMSGFVVQGPKSDYRDSSGLKNGLYPICYSDCGGSFLQICALHSFGPSLHSRISCQGFLRWSCTAAWHSSVTCLRPRSCVHFAVLEGVAHSFWCQASYDHSISSTIRWSGGSYQQNNHNVFALLYRWSATTVATVASVGRIYL